MNRSRYKYHCQNCRSRIKNAGEALISNDQHMTYFCSEECIVEFYTPEINYFEEAEIKLRNDLEIGSENLKAEEFVSDTVENFDELWMDKNEFGLEYYTLIKKFEDKRDNFCILICLFYDKKPSVVLHHTMTSFEEVLRYYRKGVQISSKFELAQESSVESEEIVSNEDLEKEQLVLPQDVIDNIENLRSSYLADYLHVRSESDIPMEKFSYYDNCIEPCISEPDEVCEFIDKSGCILNTHIKSFSYAPEDSFFYYVICLKLDEKFKDQETPDEDVLIPVLSFPSNSRDIYSHFRKGDMITRKSVN